MTLPPLTFSAFETAPPTHYVGDPIWNTRMYRMAVYLGSRCTCDVSRLGQRVTLQVAHQFIRAVSSIEANIAEGYSRTGTADQTRFYTYALGSVREAIAWMDSLRDTPWPPREEYLDLLVQIRRQLLTAIRCLRTATAETQKGRPRGRPIPYPHRKS
jgi:four helix bundle protein